MSSPGVVARATYEYVTPGKVAGERLRPVVAQVPGVVQVHEYQSYGQDGISGRPPAGVPLRPWQARITASCLAVSGSTSATCTRRDGAVTVSTRTRAPARTLETPSLPPHHVRRIVHRPVGALDGESLLKRLPVQRARGVAQSGARATNSGVSDAVS